MDVNKVILLGRLGNNPVLRETKNGTPVVHFPLATSRRVRTEGAGLTAAEEGGLPAGVPEAAAEETEWHRIVVWGRQAETCAKYLSKGQTVYVEGMMRTRRFEGKDGVKKFMHEVHAENVNFLSRPSAAPETSVQAAS